MAIQAQFPSCGTLDWVDIGCGGGVGGGGGGGAGFHNHCLALQQQKECLLQQQQCNMQEQQQPQLLQNSQPLFPGQRSSNLIFPSSSAPALKCNYSNHFSQPTVAAYEEKQRREIDHYLRIQNERLRFLFQEQRKQQLSMLWKAIEAKALPVLRQKDEDIAEASKRRRELEDFLKKLEVENQEWQRVAQENEAMVVSLSNTIEQLRGKGAACSSSNGAEDAESCCDDNNRGEAGETEYINRGSLFGGAHTVEGGEFASDREKGQKMMVCKACKCRISCVLFLPCRHLSSCKACEEFLDTCPVCLTAKKASIEALMG